MYDNHPLIEAARYNDAQAEELGLEPMIKNSGVDYTTMLYLAQQRALRLTVLTNYGTAGLRRMIMTGSFDLTADDEELMMAFATACMDGIMIGWNGSSINSR
jgi:hypothetical protein